jgi:hypothetical protein
LRFLPFRRRQGLEKAQNGDGRLFRQVGMNDAPAPLPCRIGAARAWAGRLGRGRRTRARNPRRPCEGPGLHAASQAGRAGAALTRNPREICVTPKLTPRKPRLKAAALILRRSCAARASKDAPGGAEASNAPSACSIRRAGIVLRGRFAAPQDEVSRVYAGPPRGAAKPAWKLQSCGKRVRGANSRARRAEAASLESRRSRKCLM